MRSFPRKRLPLFLPPRTGGGQRGEKSQTTQPRRLCSRSSEDPMEAGYELGTMNWNPTEDRTMRIASVSHVVFAAIMIAIGIVGLIKSDFTPVWDPIPQDSHALAHLCSFISLATGIGLLWQRTVAAATRVLFAGLLLWLLLLRVPNIILSPTFGVFWPGFVTAEMVAGSWVLYTWFAADWDKQHLGFATGKEGLRIARALYGAALIFFGFAHFFDLQDTVSLVPGWLPWHVAWAYFTGGAFVAAGVAVLINMYARLAAALSSLQMGMFTLLVWVPIVATGSKDAFQWSETFVSAALTAGGWVVADSYRGLPRFAVDKR